MAGKYYEDVEDVEAYCRELRYGPAEPKPLAGSELMTKQLIEIQDGDQRPSRRLALRIVRDYMARMGAKGGRSTSPAKAAAVRANLAKGRARLATLRKLRKEAAQP